MGTMEDLLERTDAGMMDGVMDTGGWEAVSNVVSGASRARVGEQMTLNWVANGGE